MKLADIIEQPEGRRIEFKSELPSGSEIVKTILSFANDAGGIIYFGIQDKPRKIIGLDENSLIELEERLSSIIFDNCSPIILPEIKFLNHEGKYIIEVKIHKGSAPPYHLKSKSVVGSTYLRVGSSNRLASDEMVAELQRQKMNISFDSELVYDKLAKDVDITSFKKLFEDKTGELCSDSVLSKLMLIKEEQGRILTVQALVLLSDDPLRRTLFPYSKIECARFKGTNPGNFIDSKTIDTSIALQAEQAYQFVLRHISQSSTDYTGVYRNDRWEYPVIAIREVIRNAVIHRDYSLSGKDIKIAVFDDKIEITSPGKLMSSVDYNDMDSGQSEIRNRILAPVFKRLGIIEQWGNGLKLIAGDLELYPDIDFLWKEPGVSFRVVFLKKNYKPESETVEDSVRGGAKLGPSWDQVGTKLELAWDHVERVLMFCMEAKSIQEVMNFLNWSNRTKFRDKFINPLLDSGMIMMTIPKKPKSPNQKYLITQKGKNLLQNKE